MMVQLDSYMQMNESQFSTSTLHRIWQQMYNGPQHKIWNPKSDTWENEEYTWTHQYKKLQIHLNLSKQK